MRRTVFGRNKIPSAPPNSKILSLLFQNDFVDHTGINKIIQKIIIIVYMYLKIVHIK